MAAKRMSKSAVDWATAFNKASREELQSLRAFKSRQNVFIARVNKYPESIRQIDFASYKNKVANPALIDAFEKEYKAVKVPYPKDANNVLAKIEQLEVDEKASSKVVKQALEHFVEVASKYVELAEKVPGVDVMTHDLYREYFPGVLRDPKMEVQGLIESSDQQRFSGLNMPPLQEYDYKHNIQESLDWWLMRGKYKDAYANANAHLQAGEVSSGQSQKETKD